MTPWVDTEKIRVGPISPEERRAIDKFLKQSLAQHRRTFEPPHQCVSRPFVCGAVTKPKRAGRKYTASPEHIERLREYNRRRSEAIRARKEAANVAGKNEGCLLEARAA
jgi:hypothetical protein